MRHGASLALAAAGTMLAGAAIAQETERYRLERSESGYVRMDTRTGEMAICEERSGQLVCRAAADEGSAVPSDLETLEAKVKALETRVQALENSLAARLEKSLPSEEDFERTMGYMERFFRSFLGIVREFDEERRGDQPTPEGERT